MNKHKGGTEKLRLKRIIELQAAGNDPKQTKLSFSRGIESKEGKFISD